MSFTIVRVVLTVFVLAFVFSACACMPDIVSAPFEAKDLRPAALKSWGARSSREIVLSFDESVRAQAADFAFSEQEDGAVLSGIGVESAQTAETDGEPSGTSLVLLASGDFPPGLSYALSGIVYDAHGNATSFTLPFWGFNPNPPELLINELLTEGSDKHPDAIELFVRSAGNLAGVALFIGAFDDFDARYVFPSCLVRSGEHIVLHLKPEGIAAELDELITTDLSGGFDASEFGRDFWYRDPRGASLPGKNGVVVLYKNPNGDCMDALVYSERTVDSDQKYGGFGSSKFRDRVISLVDSAVWKIEQSPPRPEDAARSVGVTSTRTLCRSSMPVDSDSGSDWHIVPTKGSSLGTANSDLVYQP